MSVRAFDPDPGLTHLFCFTHPDDELAVCAWVRRLVRAGAPVHLSWTHRTAAREREARSMAAEVGVPEANLHFHGGDDGRVAEQVPDLLCAFNHMMGVVKPDRVYCAAFEHGHIDHDATNYLVRQTFAGPVFEFPMYHPYTRRIQTMGRFADPAGEELLQLTREESAFKNRLSKGYPSQNIRSVVFWYTVYRGLTLRPAGLKRHERLRQAVGTDFLTPNLPEPLKSEVARSAMWNRWVQAVRATGP